MLTTLRDKAVAFFKPHAAYDADPVDYSVPPSFASKLPWVDIDEQGVTELEDGRSIGAFFSVTPVSTEDKQQTSLDNIVSHLTSTLTTLGNRSDEHNPWVIQFFARDIDDVSNIMPALHQQARIHDDFTTVVLNEDEKHLNVIGREQGIFSVNNRAWRGRTRQIFMAIYRWLPENAPSKAIIQNRQQLRSLQRFVLNPSAFADHGVTISRASADTVFNWLAPFFNPTQDRHVLSYRKQYSAIDKDYAERLLSSHVTADTDNGLWWFTHNKKTIANRVVELDSWSSEHFLSGRIFGEVGDNGQEKRVIFDELPIGSLFSMTLVPQSIRAGQARINTIKAASVGNEPDIKACREYCEHIDDLLNKHTLWRGQIAVYLQGQTVEEIDNQTETLRSAFDVKGLGGRFVDNNVQIAPLMRFSAGYP
ncbi:TraC family protein [Photobacterium leiognathi]|uniref:TraC family protein n=1 Tax=Photobacterium leiognathi TaxID=553611 RepID=UPI00273A1396|nr:TraC family protein [Photobacterium leiognathi]